MSEEVLDGLNIQLSKLYEKIRRQEGPLETIQHERDLSCRQLEVAVADNSVLVEDNRTLRISIPPLKDEIRDKDRLCLETHVRARQLAVYFAHLQQKIKQVEQNLHNADEMSTEYRNKIEGSMDLIKQADSTTRSRIRSPGISNRALLHLPGAQPRSKARILESGVYTSTRQSEHHLDLRADLDNVPERQKVLVTRASPQRGLMLEQIRLQKSLLQESGKCRALKDILEKPINVHAWKFLEGTSPELAQILRMAHEIRDRLMLKIYVLQRLKADRDKLKAQAKVLDIYLTKSYQRNTRKKSTF
jgi:hypothetical protein